MGVAMRRVLASSWTQRGALALLLWPVSVLYGALVALRKRLYRIGWFNVERVAVPVIVVGNAVAGGAGKTPVVMALVGYLQSRGFNAGVVARGYGRHGTGCREVHADSRASEVGDEPILIRRTTGAPVFVAAARAEAAGALLARHPDVNILVCDDGLQHYGLHRDIEICVFDEGGTGNGFLLPAGPLREPWPRPTNLILSSGNLKAKNGFSLHRTLASHARRADGTRVALKDLRAFKNLPNAELWAVAGIARPEAFFSMLRSQGLPLARTVALPDHAGFDGPDWSATPNHTLVCTEKDAVKLWRHRPDALAVPLVLRIEPAFWDALDKLLVAPAGAKLSSVHGHTTS